MERRYVCCYENAKFSKFSILFSRYKAHQLRHDIKEHVDMNASYSETSEGGLLKLILGKGLQWCSEYLADIREVVIVKSNEFKIIGKRIKILRIEKGVSQIDLAKQLDLSQTNVSNIECGRIAVTVSNLFKIRNVLGCSMGDFFVDIDNRK